MFRSSLASLLSQIWTNLACVWTKLPYRVQAGPLVLVSLAAAASPALCGGRHPASPGCGGATPPRPCRTTRTLAGFARPRPRPRRRSRLSRSRQAHLPQQIPGLLSVGMDTCAFPQQSLTIPNPRCQQKSTLPFLNPDSHWYRLAVLNHVNTLHTSIFVFQSMLQPLVEEN